MGGENTVRTHGGASRRTPISTSPLPSSSFCFAILRPNLLCRSAGWESSPRSAPVAQENPRMDPEQPVSQNTHSGNYSKGCKSVGCMKLVLTSSTYVSAKSVRDDPRKLSLWRETPRVYDSVRHRRLRACGQLLRVPSYQQCTSAPCECVCRDLQHGSDQEALLVCLQCACMER
jgi:hypothetical protein